MPRSLARGDYSLLMAVESSSRPNSWYRVLVDRQSRLLSCDCPVWTFNRQTDAQGHRSCQHTDFGQMLIGGTPIQAGGRVQVSTTSPLLDATTTQWPGLRGQWQLQQAEAAINTHPYSVVLLRL